MKSMFSVILLGILCACAPAVEGSTISRPLKVQTGVVKEKVLSGQTWYVSETVNPSSFGYSLSDRNKLLNDAVKNISKGQRGTKSVTRDFRFDAVNIPDGWEVYLQNAYLEREIMDVDGTTYSYSDSVYFIFGVKIPEGVRGSRLLTLSLGRLDYKKQVQFNLRVENP